MKQSGQIDQMFMPLSRNQSQTNSRLFMRQSNSDMCIHLGMQSIDVNDYIDINAICEDLYI